MKKGYSFYNPNFKSYYNPANHSISFIGNKTDYNKQFLIKMLHNYFDFEASCDYDLEDYFESFDNGDNYAYKNIFN